MLLGGQATAIKPRHAITQEEIDCVVSEESHFHMSRNCFGNGLGCTLKVKLNPLLGLLENKVK